MAQNISAGEASFLTATKRNVYFILRKGGSQLLYTLPINPKGIQTTDPYLVKADPGINGKLTVQRGGVVVRQITIRGTTGVGFYNQDKTTGLKVSAEEKTFPARKIFPQAAAGPTSGISHFQFLQDKVFRAYSELLQGPKPEEVSLEFYNPIDDQYWVVEPTSFEDMRPEQIRNLQFYQIDMLAVAPVAVTRGVGQGLKWGPPTVPKTILPTRTVHVLVDGVPTKAPGLLETILKELNDAVVQAQDGLKLSKIPGLGAIVQAVKDVVQVVSAVVNTVRAVAQLMADIVNGIVDLVTSISKAITDLINLPGNLARTLLGSALGGTANALDNFGVAVDTAVGFTEDLGDIAQTQLDQVQRAKNNLAEAWDRASVSSKTDGVGQGANALSSQDEAVIAQTRSLDYAEDSGLAPQSGSLAATGFITGERAGILSGPIDPAPDFKSIRRIQLRRGYSLPMLAQEEMGDFRLWKYIAAVNHLRSPYVSADLIPGTVRPGDWVRIPDTSSPPGQDGTPLEILPGFPGDPEETRFWGTDFRTVEVDGVLDLAVDPNGNDIAIASGPENLLQALGMRLAVEAGSYAFDPALGVQRFVGEPNTDDVVARAVISGRAALLADPRVEAVESIVVESNGDQLFRTARVRPIGGAVITGTFPILGG